MDNPVSACINGNVTLYWDCDGEVWSLISCHNSLVPGRTSHYWIWSDPCISYNNTVWLKHPACIQLIASEKRNDIFFNLSKTHSLTYSNAWKYIRSPATAAFTFKTDVVIYSSEGMYCFRFCVTSIGAFQPFAILTLAAYTQYCFRIRYPACIHRDD